MQETSLELDTTSGEHSSGLGNDGDPQLLGSWAYGPRPSTYHISRDAGDLLRLEQNLGRGKKVHGTLLPHGEWLQAEIWDEFSAVMGTIRLRLLGNSGLAISNFLRAGASEWGPDTIARKLAGGRHAHACMETGIVAREVDDSTTEEDVDMDTLVQATQLDGDDDCEASADRRAPPKLDGAQEEDADADKEATDDGQQTAEAAATQLVAKQVEDIPDEDDELERALSQIMGEAELQCEASTAGSAASASTPWKASMLALPLQPGAKINATTSWDRLWSQLQSQGWRSEYGPKGKDLQIYYLPPGVNRCSPYRARRHYFDSKLLVVRHVLGTGRVVIEVSGEDVEDDGDVGMDKRLRTVARPTLKPAQRKRRHERGCGPQRARKANRVDE